MHKVSFVIPAYNEAAIIRKTLMRLKKNFIHAEIIVSDDGSSDGTYDACKGLGAVVLRQKHKGYSPAVRQGINKASGDLIVILDANIPFFLDELKAILDRPVDYDVLVCSRIGYGRLENGFFRGIRSKLYNFLVKKFLSLDVSDVNGVKVILRSKLRCVDIRGSGWVFGAELLYKFKKRGMKISQSYINFCASVDNRSNFNLRSVILLGMDVLKLKAGLL